MSEGTEWSEISEQLVAEWQMEWDASDKGRITHHYIPRIDERLRIRLGLDGYVVQVLTGHGNFAAKLCSFNLAVSDRCLCGQEETGEHVLWECTLYDEVRQEYPELAQVPREAIVYSKPHFKKFQNLVKSILIRKQEDEQLLAAL